MNRLAIWEIGNIIHVRNDWKFKKLSPEQIVKSIEYQKEFKSRYPELARLAESSECEQARELISNLLKEIKQLKLENKLLLNNSKELMKENNKLRR